MQMFLSVNLCSDKTSVFLCLNAKEMLSQMSIYRFLGIVPFLIILYLCTGNPLGQLCRASAEDVLSDGIHEVIFYLNNLERISLIYL